jgi:hypothetical protein
MFVLDPRDARRAAKMDLGESMDLVCYLPHESLLSLLGAAVASGELALDAPLLGEGPMARAHASESAEQSALGAAWLESVLSHDFRDAVDSLSRSIQTDGLRFSSFLWHIDFAQVPAAHLWHATMSLLGQRLGWEPRSATGVRRWGMTPDGSSPPALVDPSRSL